MFHILIPGLPCLQVSAELDLFTPRALKHLPEGRLDPIALFFQAIEGPTNTRAGPAAALVRIALVSVVHSFAVLRRVTKIRVKTQRTLYEP